MNNERKITLGLAAALVLVALAMYGWKVAAVGSVESKLAEADAQQAQAHAALIEQAKQLDASRGQNALSRFCVPLAWAIRRELIANNLDQVDQYFTELVALPGMSSTLLAGPDGKILVASDRKKLTASFSSLYPPEYLQASQIKVVSASNGGLIAVVPIMGLNQRLATLVLEYTPPAYPVQ